MGADFVADLAVGRFHGVGPATAAKMERLGIRTGRDLRECTVAFLAEHFGKIGPYYHGIARGIDERPVRANRIRKSVGAENTFSRDLFEKAEMREALAPILDKVWRHCEASGTRGRTVTLKVKYADFRQITRALSGTRPVGSRAMLEEQAFRLLADLAPDPRGVRLLGVTLSALAEPAANEGSAVPVQFALPF
ncbi:DNA polymerase-4 [Aureimonas jatrophae]|uniref:DNA-directed DNA polymerase n=1 Tax=Aureimonas jatrophae TaxID=1166073 RepID=A0A1H0HGF6_9HYPH|nr:DNA polymerase-4 [Aureimonas jatrophae]